MGGAHIGGEPSGALGDEQGADTLSGGDHNTGAEDPAPGGTVAEEVAEGLRQHDAHIDTDLGHGAEQAALGGG